MDELAFYVCTGVFLLLAPLSCLVHTRSPEAMRIRQVSNISVFLGWFVLFLGGVFMDMGSPHDDGKLFIGLMGWAPAFANFFLWFFLFWIYHKFKGRPWPTRFADECIVTRRRWWS
jgi:hypothetical protein